MASGTIYGTTADSQWTFAIDWSESDTSISGNTSKVTAKVYIGRASTTSYIGGNYSLTININGSSDTLSGNIPYPTYISGRRWLYLKERTVTVTHNTDGSKACSISASLSSGDFTPSWCSASGTATLSTIPRYANVSQAIVGKTETSFSIDWTSDSTVDYMWYKYAPYPDFIWTEYQGVDVADGTSGSYTISGLQAGKLYAIITKFRRKDSQLETEDDSLADSTYAYPFANSMPNFTLGNKVKIGLFNPLGRQVRVDFLANNNYQLLYVTTNGTEVELPTDGLTAVNYLYSTIPNDQNGSYKIKVTYNSQSQTDNGGYYAVNPSVCSPVVGSCSYADSNASVVAITGDDQSIVRNHSTVQYTASGLAGQKGATITDCEVSVNGQTYNLTISGSTATGGNAIIDSGTDVTATFTITDSRGLTTVQDITVDMVNWANPTGIITIHRQDNFYTETDFKVDAQYTNIGTNAITITYSATRDGGVTVTGTLADNVTSVVNLDNNYAWDITIVLVDSFGGTTTYYAHISRGMPIIYFDRLKSSVGVNCFPEYDHSFEVNGVDYTIDDEEYLELAELLADDYSDTATYYVGQFCKYNNKIWECKNAITYGQQWTASNWTELG